MLADPDGISLTSLDSFNVSVARPAAFTGGSANTRGDDGGTSDPLTLFNVTGDVLIRLFGVCTVDLVSAGAGTLEVGVVGNTGEIIPTTTATDIDANDIWNTATPAVKIDVLSDIRGPYVLVNGNDIIETVATADITAGNIYYICLWRPLSPNSKVESNHPSV